MYLASIFFFFCILYYDEMGGLASDGLSVDTSLNVSSRMDVSYAGGGAFGILVVYVHLFQPEMAGFGSKISYKTENHDILMKYS